MVNSLIGKKLERFVRKSRNFRYVGDVELKKLEFSPTLNSQKHRIIPRSDFGERST